MNNDITRAYLAYIIVSSVFLVLILLFFSQVPPENKDMLNFAFGNVFGIAVTVTVAGFYFGSSDKKKNSDE